MAADSDVVLEALECWTAAFTTDWCSESERLQSHLSERQILIERLAGILSGGGASLGESEIRRIEAIEHGGAAIIAGLRQYRESLLAEVSSTVRQRSLIDCIASISSSAGPANRIDL
jgi:hypothetical protein